LEFVNRKADRTGCKFKSVKAIFYYEKEEEEDGDGSFSEAERVGANVSVFVQPATGNRGGIGAADIASLVDDDDRARSPSPSLLGGTRADPPGRWLGVPENRGRIRPETDGAGWIRGKPLGQGPPAGNDPVAAAGNGVEPPDDVDDGIADDVLVRAVQLHERGEGTGGGGRYGTPAPARIEGGGSRADSPLIIPPPEEGEGSGTGKTTPITHYGDPEFEEHREKRRLHRQRMAIARWARGKNRGGAGSTRGGGAKRKLDFDYPRFSRPKY
jgi:hypothetical protein